MAVIAEIMKSMTPEERSENGRRNALAGVRKRKIERLVEKLGDEVIDLLLVNKAAVIKLEENENTSITPDKKFPAKDKWMYEGKIYFGDVYDFITAQSK